MERINQIIKHPFYVECLNKNKEYEKERIFCKHDMNHFLDVCRIAENLYLKHCLDVLEPFISEVLPEEVEQMDLTVMECMDDVFLELTHHE